MDDHCARVSPFSHGTKPSTELCAGTGPGISGDSLDESAHAGLREYLPYFALDIHPWLSVSHPLIFSGITSACLPRDEHVTGTGLIWEGPDVTRLPWLVARQPVLTSFWLLSRSSFYEIQPELRKNQQNRSLLRLNLRTESTKWRKWVDWRTFHIHFSGGMGKRIAKLWKWKKKKPLLGALANFILLERRVRGWQIYYFQYKATFKLDHERVNGTPYRWQMCTLLVESWRCLLYLFRDREL